MKRLTIAMGIAATTGTRSRSSASATLLDTQGRSVGQAQSRQTPQGLLLKLELTNATPGRTR